MDDFDFELNCLEGEKNVLADCFSRLPRMDKISMGDKELKMIQQNKGTIVDFKKLTLQHQDELLFTSTKPKDWTFDHGITTRTSNEPAIFPQTCNNNDTEIIECLLNLPSLQELPNPLTIINIRNHQLNDPWLLQTQQLDPLRDPINTINNHNIICFREIINQPDQHWKIYIPPALIQPAIRWYHLVLGHPGSQRLYDTI